jgi:hypothetical protein
MNTESERDRDEPRRLTGEAAYKAHLESIDKRNIATRKKAAADRLTSDLATTARARRLKGD